MKKKNDTFDTVVELAAYTFVFTTIIYFCWNWTMPHLVGANNIGYWQSMALFFLTVALFKKVDND